MIPYPSQDPEVIFERIKQINEIEKIDVLIPTLDAEILSYINIEKKLNEIGIKMFLPTKESFNMRSKNILADFCLKNDISAPKTISVSSVEEIYKMDLNYPVYVKGIFYDAYIAYSYAEASQAFYTISAKWGVPIVIQEFINGE
jgi:carbamoyl-phosphate synthase large subunit